MFLCQPAIGDRNDKGGIGRVTRAINPEIFHGGSLHDINCRWIYGFDCEMRKSPLHLLAGWYPVPVPVHLDKQITIHQDGVPLA